jgi:hypothetical protein
MQPMVRHKIIIASLILAMAAPLAGMAQLTTQPKKATATEFQAINFTPVGYIVAGLLGSALYLYTQLNYKKTEPKRVYPKDDSWFEFIKFIHDELLVGQKYLPERAAAAHQDPENPERMVYEYSKVEARGLAGQTQYYMEKVVWPTVVLMVAINAFKQALGANTDAFITFVNDPKKLVEIVPPAKAA